MQTFTFTHQQQESGYPSDHVTVSVEAGTITMDEILNKFTEFLRACGYVVPYDSQLEIVSSEPEKIGCHGECDTCVCE